MVPVAGVEPARVISPTDFESVTSANSITPANAKCIIQDAVCFFKWEIPQRSAKRNTIIFAHNVL